MQIVNEEELFLIENRIWREWRNYEGISKDELSKWTVKQKKEHLDWLDKERLKDREMFDLLEGEEGTNV